MHTCTCTQNWGTPCTLGAGQAATQKSDAPPLWLSTRLPTHATHSPYLPTNYTLPTKRMRPHNEPVADAQKVPRTKYYYGQQAAHAITRLALRLGQAAVVEHAPECLWPPLRCWEARRRRAVLGPVPLTPF